MHKVKELLLEQKDHMTNQVANRTTPNDINSHNTDITMTSDHMASEIVNKNTSVITLYNENNNESVDKPASHLIV